VLAGEGIEDPRIATAATRHRHAPRRSYRMTSFKIGDKAVVPALGVGVVKDIVSQDLDGEAYQMYVITILDKALTFKVPLDQVDAKGVREPIPMEAVERVYEVLRDRTSPRDKQTWNRRYREYMAKIKTGDPLEVAAVLRDLALLRADKQLSFGERKMYDQAHSLIVQEVAVTKDVDEQVIKAEIEALFAPT
jgi:CarD family transcriptional regulator